MSDASPGPEQSTAHPPGASLPPRDDEIENYRLIELIGEGGMGEVYKAEQRGAVQRIVALKIIRVGLDSRTVIARFEAERQALALMNHANIARVFDGGTTTQGRPYFAMEYVAGEPITIYCDRHKLPIRARLELFRDVCDAVQHAHTKGVIHRDLKASNVLIAEQDGKLVPKVIDFGVAKALSHRLTEKTLFTESGRLVGTPAYASPEQAEGGPDVDTRTDVYSLGVLLYELLTGALPFDPTKLREMAYGEMQRIIREVDPPRPSTFYSQPSESSREAAQRRAATVEELASTLRHELEWIPLRAMRKERGERYQTAADFARDIENYLAGRPLIAAPDSRWYRLTKAVKRNRRLVAAVAAVMLTLILGIVMTTWQARRAEHQRQLAEASTEEARKRLAQAEASATLLNELFEAIQPNVVQGRDTELLVDVLRAAEPKIEQILSEPSWRAEHLVILGNAFRILGETERARQLLERAKALAEQSFDAAVASGEMDPGQRQARTLIDALEKLGELHLTLGNAIEAEPLLRQALAIAESHLPAGDVLVTDQLANIGSALRVQALTDPAKLPQALDFYNRALARATADPAKHPPPTRASLALMRGAALLAYGDVQAAEESFALAESLLRGDGKARTTEYASVLAHQAALELHRGDHEAALGHINAAMTLRQELGAKLDPLGLASCYTFRAAILGAMGRPIDASNDQLESLRLQRLAISNPDAAALFNLASGMHNVGFALQEARQLEAAAAALSEALGVYDDLFARAQEQRAAADPAIRAALDAQLLDYRKQHLATQQRWAQITLELGDAQAALPVIRECLDRQRALYAGDTTQAALWMLAASQWVLAEAMLAVDPQQTQEPLALLLDANQKLIDGKVPTTPTRTGRPSVREKVLRRLLSVYEAIGDEPQMQRITQELQTLGS